MGVAFTLLFALRVGASVAYSGVAHPGLPGVGLRQSSREAVARTEGVRRPPTVRDALSMSLVAAPAAFAGEQVDATANPFHHAYGPEDWLAFVAGGLELRDTKLIRAARWLVDIPVKLDLDPQRVVVEVSLPAF